MTNSGRTGTLTWYTVGDESARPMLMIHALGADSEMWEAQLPDLSSMRRVVMVDLPGHGNSVPGPGPYTIRDLGEDILDVATTAGVAEFDLCGISLGGLISLWIAGHSPDRVLSLTASNTAARIGSEEIWQARIDTVAAGGMVAVSEQALARFFTSTFATRHHDTVERASRTLLTTDPAAYMACCAALRDADLRELVEAIRCPTLVIGGSDDISTPPDESVWLHEQIEGSALHILDGAPHFANLEQPEAWTALVTGFLAEHGPG
jgi:3-oxoadipate enol-lactonase